jgi:hypothetical protein
VNEYRFEALVSQALDNALDNHRIEREAFYTALWEELDKDGQSFWRRVEAAADFLVSDAKALTTSSATPFEPLCQLHVDAPEAAGTAAALAVIQHAQHLIGCDVVGMMRTAEKRMVALLSLAARLNPGLPAAAFLKQVGKCYLFGFDAECVVMCRSVLDRKFDSHVSADDCVSAIGPNHRRNRKGEPMFDLYDRIQTSRTLRKLGDEVVVAAEAVREAGNEAVHRFPKYRGDVITIIEKTMLVVRALDEL